MMPFRSMAARLPSLTCTALPGPVRYNRRRLQATSTGSLASVGLSLSAACTVLWAILGLGWEPSGSIGTALFWAGERADAWSYST